MYVFIYALMTRWSYKYGDAYWDDTLLTVQLPDG